MTTGTKVFLACFALLVAALVVYYGVLVPSGPQGVNAGIQTLGPAATAPVEQPLEKSRFETTIDEIADAGRSADSIPTLDGAAATTAPPDVRSNDPVIQPPSSNEPVISTVANSTPATTPTTTAEPVRYTIAEGDTLSSIALDFLGDPNAWPRIRDANPGLNPNRLRVGDEIILPGLKGLASRPEPGALYVVREGETLIDIARTAYGRDGMWKRIFEANRATIGDPDRLEVGMRLRLPTP